jgi:hypothetical protein
MAILMLQSAFHAAEDTFGSLPEDHLTRGKGERASEAHRYENTIASEFVAAATFRLGRT